MSTLVGLSASVLVHVWIAAILAAMREPVPTVSSKTLAATVSFELVPSGIIGRVEGDERVSAAAPPVPGGPTTTENRDAYELGQGGDAVGALHVMQLVNRVDGVLLTNAQWNSPKEAQLQRIRTADDRATPMDQRATPHPADEAFLASGDGRHRERRPPSPRDPRVGAADAKHAATPTPPTPAATGEDAPSPPAREDTSPAQGIAAGAGRREAEAAKVAFGRPDITKGYATTSTDWDANRVRDNVDAPQVVNQLTAAGINASPERAPRDGIGAGGPGPTGVPGIGPDPIAGGRALARSPGPGAYASVGDSDAGYADWFAEQRRRVRRELHFPKERQLAMDQGTSLYRFQVRRDGSLAAGPALLRSSGFADLDAAARTAIERALPFGPVPPELAPDFQVLQIVMPVAFQNPTFH